MSRKQQVVGVSALAFCLYLLVESFLPAPCQPTARISLALIRAYQTTGSPALHAAGVRCRYTPSCSHYAQDAIGAYGTLGGALRTAGRLWRCSPWGGSGYDPAVEPHAAAYLEPQETDAQRRERERITEEQIRRVQENLSKPADQAAMDEVGRAMREGLRTPPGGQAGMQGQGTDEERRKRDEEEIKKAAREAAKACLPAGLMCAVAIAGLIAYLVVKIILMIWCYKDAVARGDSNAIIWPLLIFFLTPMIGVIVYLVARPKGEMSPCGSCHRNRMIGLSKCPHCGADGGAPASSSPAK